jgi:hypothetical protein
VLGGVVVDFAEQHHPRTRHGLGERVGRRRQPRRRLRAERENGAEAGRRDPPHRDYNENHSLDFTHGRMRDAVGQRPVR